MRTAVVTCCDSPPVFEFSEHAFDLVPLAIEGFAIGVFSFTPLTGWDAGLHAFRCECVSELIAVIPDVVLYDAKRNWLFLVEAVTSHGPMSPKRIVELEEMMAGCKAGPVYVSAFPDFAEFRKHMKAIAWDTEVWLSDTPDCQSAFNLDPLSASNFDPLCLASIGWECRCRRNVERA